MRRLGTRKLHYAWIIAFTGLLITGGGVGIFNTSIGVFIKPVCDDLGFLRGQFSLYTSIAFIVSVLLMPLFGSLFKRFGFRRLAVTGATTCGLVLFSYSFVSELWQFYLLAFISGLFVNGVGMMAVGILINNWFTDRRGLATGIAFSGSGLLAAALVPMANRFIELFGWRWTYRFFSCVSLFILIPIILFIVKDNPEDIGLEPYSLDEEKKAGHEDGDHQDGSALNAGLARKETLHTRTFWLLSIAIMGVGLCQAGPHIHTISFLNDIGYSMAFASVVSSTYLIFLTLFKVIMGLVLDRLGSLKGSLLIGLSCVLFPIFALFAGLPVFPWIYAFALGLASSGSTILGPILTANYFGRKNFSKIYSLVSMIAFIGIAISPPAYGSIFDVTGNYSLAWILTIGLGIVVCLCFILADRESKYIFIMAPKDMVNKT